MQTLRPTLLSLLAIVAAAAPADAQARRVDTAPVTRQHLTRVLPLVGSAEAWQHSTLVFRVEGYIKEVSVERGEILSGGAAIARVDVPDLVALFDVFCLTPTAGESLGTSILEGFLMEKLFAPEERNRGSLLKGTP